MVSTLGGRRRFRGLAGLLLVALVLSVPAYIFFWRRPPASEPRERTEFMMDTIVTITYFHPAHLPAVEAALAAMREVEAKMSAHLETSEIAAINRAAGTRPVQVSPETLATIRLGLEIGRLTGGAFDITIKPLMDLWAIGRRGDQLPALEAVEATRRLVDYRRVRIDEARREVMLEQAGMALDLGGIAKGHAVDAAARVLLEHGVTGALINAGGDIFALGQRARNRAWRIAVQHPRRSADFIAILELGNTAVVTSGDYQRFIDVDGRRYHHILDPRTGAPARGLVSATTVAPSAALADAWSTALFVLGPERGLELVRQVPGLEGLVVTPAGAVSYTPGLRGKVQVMPW